MGEVNQGLEAARHTREASPPGRSGPLASLLGHRGTPNQPPSSTSGVPTEVIQEEVQRQLGGPLTRLEQSENRNRELQQQLEALQQPQPRATAEEPASVAEGNAGARPCAGPIVSEDVPNVSTQNRFSMGWGFRDPGRAGHHGISYRNIWFSPTSSFKHLQR